MRTPRVTYASIVLILLSSLFLLAGHSAACHVTVTNEIYKGDPNDPEIALSFTLSDADGLVGPEVFLGAGEDFTWSRLHLGENYSLTQTSPLPEGWRLVDLGSNEDACWIDYDPDNFQIDFRLTRYQWNLSATFVNEYAPDNVPVPAAAWLLGTGLLGLIGFRRKIKA